VTSQSHIFFQGVYFFCTTAMPVGAFPPEANGEPARAVSAPVCELKVKTEMSLEALQT
jgi:hypothetical protein